MAESFFRARILKKQRPRAASFYIFHQLTRLLLLKEVKPPDDREMIKLLTFDNSFPYKNP